MRLLLLVMVIGLASTLVLGKKNKSTKTEKENKNVDSTLKQTSKPKEQQNKSAKGSKKQFLGYPEPDGRQTQVQGPFGQGLPGYGGGMGNGGMGSEMEGMPVGIGGGGEPLGFKDQDAPNFHVPGISRPSSYEENAEVGRGEEEDNGYASRFSKQNDLDYMQGAFSRLNVPDQDSNDAGTDREREDDVQSDELVTKAIGRPFQPENGQEEQMEGHEDSPFQQVKQESPFQVPLNSLAAQVNFANQQMSPVRPGYDGPLGQQQIETPSSQLQPEGEENGEEQEGQESSNFRATSMTGGAALMGMNDQQGGMKRHHLLKKGKKAYQKTFKRKRISHEKKEKSEKSKN